jgi:hypothetical protein
MGGSLQRDPGEESRKKSLQQRDFTRANNYLERGGHCQCRDCTLRGLPVWQSSRDFDVTMRSSRGINAERSG